MSNLPTDICNQALDAIGINFTLGDIEEGSKPAQVCLRNYGQCLRQLLRAAHWNFARKTAPLTLLADATGQTADVGTAVIVPWIYEYSYPIDCVKARFVPQNLQQNPGTPTGNITPPNPSAPIVTGLATPPLTGSRLIPARFTEAVDYNYPPLQGQLHWEVQGVSPAGRTVILTNVQNAQLVYTCLSLYPGVWDPQFRAGLVAYLASEIWSLHEDKKLGMTLRNQQIALVKQKLSEARKSDGNEGWYSSDIRVDWMQFRTAGGARSGWGDMMSGQGAFWYGWDTCAFSDGSAY